MQFILRASNTRAMSKYPSKKVIYKYTHEPYLVLSVFFFITFGSIYLELKIHFEWSNSFSINVSTRTFFSIVKIILISRSRSRLFRSPPIKMFTSWLYITTKTNGLHLGLHVVYITWGIGVCKGVYFEDTQIL